MVRTARFPAPQGRRTSHITYYMLLARNGQEGNEKAEVLRPRFAYERHRDSVCRGAPGAAFGRNLCGVARSLAKDLELPRKEGFQQALGVEGSLSCLMPHPSSLMPGRL